MEININIEELITKNFYKLFNEILDDEYDRVVLKGGRFSTKSTVIGCIIVLGMMINRQSALALVKYGNAVEGRLVHLFDFVINELLGVGDLWKLRRSPFEYVLLDEFGKETNVSIKFTGCDDPRKMKGLRPRSGHFKYIWFEEIDNFYGIKEVNNIIDTVQRGNIKSTVFMTYNPPMEVGNWVNTEFNAPVGKALGYDTDFYYEVRQAKKKDGTVVELKTVIHHSTYLDVVDDGKEDWLGLSRIADAQQAEVENNKYYRWNYLGEVIGTEANVFWNIKKWDGNTDDLNIRTIYRGMDWGLGGPDPSVYIGVYYDQFNRRLYLLNEYGEHNQVMSKHMNNMAKEIKKDNKHNFPVKADSQSPAINREMVDTYGVNVVGVKKTKEVNNGVKWLQSLNGIYICPSKTPMAYEEFKNYSYVIDKYDKITSKLSDDNDHFIDAARYALEDVIRFG